MKFTSRSLRIFGCGEQRHTALPCSSRPKFHQVSIESTRSRSWVSDRASFGCGMGMTYPGGGGRLLAFIRDPPPSRSGPKAPRGGVWHKALVVGSVSLWRRLLASRP